MREFWRIEILRGEGNVVISSPFTQQEANRVTEWLAKGSGYQVILTYPSGTRSAVGPDGNWCIV